MQVCSSVALHRLSAEASGAIPKTSIPIAHSPSSGVRESARRTDGSGESPALSGHSTTATPSPPTHSSNPAAKNSSGSVSL